MMPSRKKSIKYEIELTQKFFYKIKRNKNNFTFHAHNFLMCVVALSHNLISEFNLDNILRLRCAVGP